MKYGLTLGVYRLLAFAWLLTAGAAVLRADDYIGIKSIRTVVYEPILKDTSWVTGSVVDFIRFVKYDAQGRPIAENRLKPDGGAQGKLVYLYNSAGQVSREIYATADEGVSNCWDYTYDEKGRLNSIAYMNGKQDTLSMVSVLYNEQGKVMKRTTQSWETNSIGVREPVYGADGTPAKVIVSLIVDGRQRSFGEFQTEKWDTASLKRVGFRQLGKMRVVKDDNEKNRVTTTDERGNWTERFEGCNAEGEPKFIIRRDIVYAGEENDREKMPLRGKVKRVLQRSYVAIPKGPKAVDKGEKKGRFFLLEFDENGRKIREEKFSAAGMLTEKLRYEYDAAGNLQKEICYTPADALKETRGYLYDKEGRLKSRSVYDRKGEVVRRDAFRYDLERNPVLEVGFLTDGTKCREFRYIYDSYGQQVGCDVLLQSEGEEPALSVRRAFNFQGRIVGEEHLLPSGTGKDVYTYRYNAKGEVISGTEQLDGQSGETKFVYKFHNDPQGNWKIRIKYVADVPVVYEERELVYYE